MSEQHAKSRTYDSSAYADYDARTNPRSPSAHRQVHSLPRKPQVEDEFGRIPRVNRRSRSPCRQDGDRTDIDESYRVVPMAASSYRAHDDRPVTPPPRREPSPTYLKVALQPPTELSSEDSSSRKLLILDLNGTLLIRSNDRPKRNQNGGDSSARERLTDASGRPLPRRRPVHPRPYMKSFASYLFTPETKAWLDVMVWSSAQPYSVEDMVNHTFGDLKDGLIAIWARDTFGLSPEHYARKVQTFKDLSIPWSKLPVKALEEGEISSPPPPDSSPVSSSSSPARSNPPSHSALTTLLLDDSSRKAEMQPYNHICVSEYDGPRRIKDIMRMNYEQQTATRQQEEALDDPMISEDRSEKGNAVSSKKKRKRKQKNLGEDGELSETHPDDFDPTLLAVIGVLEAIKEQRNVAAWVRSGGLWGPSGPPLADAPPLSDAQEDGKDEGSDGSTLSVEKKRVGGTAATAKKQRLNEEHPTALAMSSEQDTVVDGANAETTKVLNETDSQAPDPPMWFENASTMEYWVSCGKRALERLNVPIAHGVDR